MTREQAEIMVETFARWLMDQIPPSEWPVFAQNSGIRIVKLAGLKPTSRSGSYRLVAPPSPFADTQPPPEPKKP